MIKKADIILFIIILAAGLLVSFGPIAHSVSGTDVTVTLDGETYGIYDLMLDKEIVVENGENTNVIVISGGQVYMDSASCKNQVCVEHAPISRAGECIVCLPNRLVVEIEGNEGGGIDVVSE